VGLVEHRLDRGGVGVERRDVDETDARIAAATATATVATAAAPTVTVATTAAAAVTVATIAASSTTAVSGTTGKQCGTATCQSFQYLTPPLVRTTV
jgi:hypothetical protein